MKKIVFIGGIFHGEIESYVLKNSTGVIQNAADTFQKNLLVGLRQIYNENLVVLNLPFVGSYPKRFKKFWFKPFFSDYVLSYGFVNLMGVKFISRFIVVVKALLGIKPSDESCVIVYSVHLPFLAAVTFYKKFICKNLKVVLIVPDLPEFMSSDNSGLIKFLKSIQSQFLKYCYKSVDGYVFLTEYMHERIPADVNHYIVVEGVSNATTVNVTESLDVVHASIKSIFYSGTLDSRYGIKELVQAVESMIIDVELLICGEGDSKNYVLDASRRTNRIKYLGQLARKDVLQVQKSSTLLINPRSDVGQFTKFSFPSKVMEYMCSGRPVLMYPLPGIPNEYYEHCFCIKGPGIEGIRDSLNNVLSMDSKVLSEIGRNAQEFVFKEKSGLKQSKKIFNLIERLK